MTCPHPLPALTSSRAHSAPATWGCRDGSFNKPGMALSQGLCTCAVSSDLQAGPGFVYMLPCRGAHCPSPPTTVIIMAVSNTANSVRSSEKLHSICSPHVVCVASKNQGVNPRYFPSCALGQAPLSVLCLSFPSCKMEVIMPPSWSQHLVWYTAGA